MTRWLERLFGRLSASQEWCYRCQWPTREGRPRLYVDGDETVQQALRRLQEEQT